MKWTLSQVSRMNMPLQINKDLDLSSYIDKLNDVESISNVNVIGDAYEMDNGYVFALDITTILKMRCAITLEIIDYPINIHVDEVFSYSNNDGDDVYLIQNDTIDIEDVVLANIMLAIPLRVVKKGSENIYSASKENLRSDNPFMELKDYFKK